MMRAQMFVQINEYMQKFNCINGYKSTFGCKCDSLELKTCCITLSVSFHGVWWISSLNIINVDVVDGFSAKCTMMNNTCLIHRKQHSDHFLQILENFIIHWNSKLFLTRKKYSIFEHRCSKYEWYIWNTKHYIPSGPLQIQPLNSYNLWNVKKILPFLGNIFP